MAGLRACGAGAALMAIEGEIAATRSGSTTGSLPGRIDETAFAIQQELRCKGITTVILPIRINI